MLKCEKTGAPIIIGANRLFQDALDQTSRAAETDGNIVILGESGTGKELFARKIHFESKRHEGPFVAFNCTALSEALIESELFGIMDRVATNVSARKGLIESADGGTLFLDEIGDMPSAAQAKLLRVIQEREIIPVGGRAPKKIDIRIIAATNLNLWEEVQNGNFRLDLFYRLNVIPIRIPTLAQRKNDITQLSRHFVKEHGTAKNQVLPNALKKLASHDWPGNVRELENVIQRAIFLAGDAKIAARHIVFDENYFENEKRERTKTTEPHSPERGKRDLEREIATIVKERNEIRGSEIRKITGIPKSSLSRHMKNLIIKGEIWEKPNGEGRGKIYCSGEYIPSFPTDKKLDELTPRQKQILRYVGMNEKTSISDISQHFDVSPRTIQREMGCLLKKKFIEPQGGGRGICYRIMDMHPGKND